MTGTLSLDVGPLVLRVRVRSSDIARSLERLYGPRFTASARPAGCLDVDLVWGPTRAAVWTGGPRWTPGGWCWEGRGATLWCSPDGRQAVLRGVSADPLAEVDYALRVLAALRAPDEHALLVHGAAVAVGKKGVLFVGPSGAGKSTAARHRPPKTTLLADDLLFLHRVNGTWRVVPTPLDAVGRHACPPRDVSPALVCSLVQDVRVAARPVLPALGAALLLHAVTLLPLLPECTRSAWCLVCDVLRTLTVVVLHFRPDATYWTALTPYLDGEDAHGRA